MAGNAQPLTHADMIRYVHDFTIFYKSTEPMNPTGKNVRDWTVADLKKLGQKEFQRCLDVIDYDDASLTQQITPNGMSIAEFHVALLREMRAKGMIALDDDPRLMAERAKGPEASVSVGLPAIAYDGATDVKYTRDPKAVPMTMPTSQAEAWVEAIKLLASEDNMPDDVRAALQAQADLAAQTLKAQGAPIRAFPKTDANAFGLGYVIGSIPALNAKKNPNGPSISVTPDMTKEQTQDTYCSGVNLIHETGNTINLADALRTGYFQARFDDRNSVTSGTELGLYAPCPLTKRLAASR